MSRALELAGADPAALGIQYEVGVDPATGAATITVPLELTEGRGSTPDLVLRYDSTGTPSPFGTGWALDGVPRIAVSTRRGVPTYTSADTFVSSEVGELVPTDRVLQRTGHTVRFWRARHESAYLRVEQWSDNVTGRVHWRTRDTSDRLTVYGLVHRIEDPDADDAVYAWLAETRVDSSGNGIRYDYDVDGAQRYLSRIRYANAQPHEPAGPWYLEAALEYSDRPDHWSTFHAGFEVRTRRLCTRIRMEHHLGGAVATVGEYQLGYRTDPVATTLTEIAYTGFGDDGASRGLPPLRFTYTEPVADREVSVVRPENTPAGLSGNYRWIDLYGEGLPGILAETPDAWYYKPNRGGGRFGPQELVVSRPAYPFGESALIDFDADGDPNVAVLSGRSGGFYAYDRDGGRWQAFRPFSRLPHAEAPHGRLHWLDLDGDGRAELTVADRGTLTWYPALGTEGFGDPVAVPLPDGAAPLAEQDRFFFADMTGDGLLDHVRVAGGRVEYWPALGRGRFGPPRVMDDAPDLGVDFDPARVLLADLDGTGPADLVYLGGTEVRWWRNAAGNAFVDGGTIPLVVDDLATARVLDFLADGTACLVWSSPLSDELRYLRLTGGVRPHLATEVVNLRGTVTTLTYGTSAAHYLTDQAAGRPWRTKLPSHVPVVDRMDVTDVVSGVASALRFVYHDGRYDAEEQRLCFATVDRFDTAPDAPESSPGCTKVWFHSGRPGPLAGAWDDLQVSSDLDGAAEDVDGALRALAGSLLREEVYAVAPDGVLAEVPLSVTRFGYRVTRLAEDAFAVHQVERLTSLHEGVADDPRVSHEVVLDLDEHGCELLACELAYPRRAGAGAAPAPARVAQSVGLATATRVDVVHVDEPDRYRTGVEVQRREYELTGLRPDVRPTRDELRGAAAAGTLRGWRRQAYWDEAGSGPLPFGEAGRLPHSVEEACCTPEFLADALDGEGTEERLHAAGYNLHDGFWWRPGVVTVYGDRFDLVTTTVRPGGATTSFGYDPAELRPVRVTEPTGEVTRAELDPRLLAPVRVTDPNGTVAEVRFDPLGVAVLTGLRGLVDGAPYGSGPLPEPRAGPVVAALGDPVAFLGDASSAVFYDLDSRPPRTLELSRELHAHAGPSRVAVEISYHDGSGRVLQSRTGLDGGRWLVSGLTVYNAKQEPVRQYEPFFADDPRYALPAGGVVHTFAYDAVGRLVRQEAPDHTVARTVYGPWSTTTYDADDTVRDSGWALLRQGLPPGDPECQAYETTLPLADTPVVSHLDASGAEVVSEDAGALTVSRLDVDGEPVELVDPRGIAAVRYHRDLVGRVWRTDSADAGTFRTLVDVHDRPLHEWDGRGGHVERRYDDADRPTEVLSEGRLLSDVGYGDDPAANTVGRPVRRRDGAGVVTVERYTPEGSALRTVRQVPADHTTEPDWSAAVDLAPERYASEWDYDALGRVTLERPPDGTVRSLSYLAGGGLDRIRVDVDGTSVDVLAGIEYTARGDRSAVVLGNGSTVRSEFDEETGRLRRRLVSRGTPGTALSDVRYTYDPVGNVLRVEDAALPFLRAAAPALATYTYDPWYRLATATGRVSQALLGPDHPGGGQHLSFNNGDAVETYRRVYGYDAGGNLHTVRHAGATRSWTNRLTVSAGSDRGVPGDSADPDAGFDGAGNPIALPHLRRMSWSASGLLASAVVVERDGQPDDAEYYAYDGDGRRVRKVYERLVGGAVEATEVLYLDGCEITRISTEGRVTLERVTSSVSDERGPLASLHRWRVDTAGRETTDLRERRIRYPIGNHVGAVDLVLAEDGAVVSYEEYFPFGGTAFVAGSDAREVRERGFAGKEQDAATGLSYFGFRYYAPWLGRWLTPDPLGASDDGLNLYVYCRDNPVTLTDPDGLQTGPGEQSGRVTLERTTQPRADILAGLTAGQRQQYEAGTHGVVATGQGGYTTVPLEQYAAAVRGRSGTVLVVDPVKEFLRERARQVALSPELLEALRRPIDPEGTGSKAKDPSGTGPGTSDTGTQNPVPKVNGGDGSGGGRDGSGRGAGAGGGKGTGKGTASAGSGSGARGSRQGPGSDGDTGTDGIGTPRDDPGQTPPGPGADDGDRRGVPTGTGDTGSTDVTLPPGTGPPDARPAGQLATQNRIVPGGAAGRGTIRGRGQPGGARTGPAQGVRPGTPGAREGPARRQSWLDRLHEKLLSPFNTKGPLRGWWWKALSLGLYGFTFLQGGGLGVLAAAGKAAGAGTKAAAGAVLAVAARVTGKKGLRALTRPPSNPRAYSVAFQFKLKPQDFGTSRALHRARAAEALRDAMRADPQFAAEMAKILGKNILKRLESNPPSLPFRWVWHHALAEQAKTVVGPGIRLWQRGVLQLVPRYQHWGWWRLFHPRGTGGFKEWAIPAGAI